MKNIYLLICFASLFFTNTITSQTFGSDDFRWKHKTDISTFGLAGVGSFWNIKKADNPNWNAGLGFRFDVSGSIFFLGPSFDLHRIIDKGKFSPMYGVQLGVGAVFYSDFLEFDDAYYHVTPYAGINIKVNTKIQLEAGLHLRYTGTYSIFNFFSAPLFFALKF